MTNWKELTCEKCKYRVDDECRRFPPQYIQSSVSGEMHYGYPNITHRNVNEMGDLYFEEACAEYAEEGQVSEVVHGACRQILREPVGTP